MFDRSENVLYVLPALFRHDDKRYKINQQKGLQGISKHAPDIYNSVLAFLQIAVKQFIIFFGFAVYVGFILFVLFLNLREMDLLRV